MQVFLFVFLFITNLVFGQVTEIKTVEPDKSVQWGYKAILKPGTTLEQLKSLRKVLKAKGVSTLYPSDRDWKLPTGYLSLSSYWDADDIQKLSPLIASVQSAEITQRYQLNLVSSTNSQQVTKLLKAFSSNKIQVLYHASGEVPLFFSVKTTLTPEQIKQIEEVGPYLESIQR
jgi:murein L,D-transpeptidase YcbB/YkuD